MESQKEIQKDAPITTLYDLTSQLAHMRQRQASEMAEFLGRIDPKVFANRDRDELMQPMMLGILEKQQQTHQLLTLLNVACPVTNKEGDDILLGLYRPWLEEVDENVEAKAKEAKAASENVEKETAKGKVKVAWTIREVSILHALYPILGHDHEAYESVLPNRSAASIASKIEKEYFKGHLPKHDARAHYKRPQSIDSEITKAAADYWASIKDTIAQSTSSTSIHADSITSVRSTPIPNAKKTSRAARRPKKLDDSDGKTKVSGAIADHERKRTARDEGDYGFEAPTQKRTRRPRATKDRAIDAIKDTIETMRTPFSHFDLSDEDAIVDSTHLSISSAATPSEYKESPS